MQFEILFQDLANGAEMIRALFLGVSQSDATCKPDPESWSMLEVLCHLYDEEREDFRQHLDAILHRPTEPWIPIDPQGWVTSRNYNESDLAETLARFLDERQQSLAWLRGLSAPDWETEHRDEHGSMRAGEMLACWVAHDNLHMRQLVELRRARILGLVEPYDVGYAGDW